MSSHFSLNFLNSPTTPVAASRRHVSVQKLINFLVRLISGRYPSGTSVDCRTAAVKATMPVVFTGGVAANDTVTLNGTALTAQQEYAAGTVTFNGLQADDSVTVGASIFVAKVSPSTALQFALGASDTEAATNLVAKINAHATASTLAKAYDMGSGVAVVRNLVYGVAGNHAGGSHLAFTSSNNSRAAVTGTSTGDLNGASATANNKFHIGYTKAEAAAALAACVTASSTNLVSGHVTAASDGVDTVTLKAKVPGVAGNAITTAKSAANISSLAGARMTGGTETAFSFNF